MSLWSAWDKDFFPCGPTPAPTDRNVARVTPAGRSGGGQLQGVAGAHYPVTVEAVEVPISFVTFRSEVLFSDPERLERPTDLGVFLNSPFGTLVRDRARDQ